MWAYLGLFYAYKLGNCIHCTFIITFFVYRYTVVFWPSTWPKMPFKVMHRKEVTHSIGSYERKLRRWAQLIIWDKVKVPLQSDAPEESDLWTAWQLFPLDDNQTCHAKDWVGDRVGVELLYNSVKTEVRQLEIRQVRRQAVVEKARRRGPLGAQKSWGPEKLLIRCSKKSHHPAESWAAGPLVEHLENEKDATLTAIRVGVNILQLCSVSNSLSP